MVCVCFLSLMCCTFTSALSPVIAIAKYVPSLPIPIRASRVGPRAGTGRKRQHQQQNTSFITPPNRSEIQRGVVVSSCFEFHFDALAPTLAADTACLLPFAVKPRVNAIIPSESVHLAHWPTVQRGS